MAQIKIYGERERLRAIRSVLSDVIHATGRQVLGLPGDKRFHRFISLDAEDFLHPPDRSAAYTKPQWWRPMAHPWWPKATKDVP